MKLWAATLTVQQFGSYAELLCSEFFPSFISNFNLRVTHIRNLRKKSSLVLQNLLLWNIMYETIFLLEIPKLSYVNGNIVFTAKSMASGISFRSSSGLYWCRAVESFVRYLHKRIATTPHTTCALSIMKLYIIDKHDTENENMKQNILVILFSNWICHL